MSRALKVLHVVDTLGMGGAETWLMELLRYGARKGNCQTDILITSGNRGIFDDEAQKLGARLHYLKFGRAHLKSFVGKFREILREGNYDAIHDHADYFSGWHFLLGLGVLPPVRVAHVHNPWLHIDANYGVTFMRRLTVLMGKNLVRALATDVCGTSAEILVRYGFKIGKSRGLNVSVVHCGIDIQKFCAPRELDRQSVLAEFHWPPDAKIVLFAGRLDRALEFNHPQNHKNSWFALNVVKEAVEIDPAVRFLVAGAGDDPRRELERHVAQWALQDQIRFLGVRHDIPRLLRAADVLFFPSRQEGLGMIAVEAQAACLPVLASASVPSECIIVPELYEALPLTEPMGRWASALVRCAEKSRPSLEYCRGRMEASAFSVEISEEKLEVIYGAACRCAQQ